MAQYNDKDKNLETVLQQDVPIELESGEKAHHRVVDLAAQAHIEQVDYTEAESNAVLRKIDWHLMPMLIWICESPLYVTGKLVLTIKTAYNTPTSRL